MWTGSVAFGLVNVPVKMYAATEDHDVHFHEIHPKDNGRIRQQRKCSECGEYLEYKDLGKAYETETGQLVKFAPEDFADLPVAGAKEIEVLQFVPSTEIDPVLFNKSYYLEPEPRAVKPYVLLREALRASDRTAVVKIAIRTRQQLAALRVRGDIIMLQTMLWPDEVRAADFSSLAAEVEIKDAELAMAGMLVDNLSAHFEPGAYTDEYRAAILAKIEDKLAGGEAVAAPAAAAATDEGKVLDLMAALQESVARTRAQQAAG